MVLDDRDTFVDFCQACRPLIFSSGDSAFSDFASSKNMWLSMLECRLDGLLSSLLLLAALSRPCVYRFIEMTFRIAHLLITHMFDHISRSARFY